MGAGQVSRRGKLKFLFEACGGENWSAEAKKGWLDEDQPIDKWAGLKLNKNKELLALSLAGNLGQVKTLSSCCARPNLADRYASHSAIGTIPREIFASGCERLEELDLSGCRNLSGPLPGTIVACQGLRKLELPPGLQNMDHLNFPNVDTALRFLYLTSGKHTKWSKLYARGWLVESDLSKWEGCWRAPSHLAAQSPRSWMFNSERGDWTPLEDEAQALLDFGAAHALDVGFEQPRGSMARQSNSHHTSFARARVRYETGHPY